MQPRVGGGDEVGGTAARRPQETVASMLSDLDP